MYTGESCFWDVYWVSDLAEFLVQPTEMKPDTRLTFVSGYIKARKPE